MAQQLSRQLDGVPAAPRRTAGAQAAVVLHPEDAEAQRVLDVRQNTCRTRGDVTVVPAPSQTWRTPSSIWILTCESVGVERLTRSSRGPPDQQGLQVFAALWLLEAGQLDLLPG